MLITGVSGLLGNNVAFKFMSKYDIFGLYCRHEVKFDKITTEACDILDDVKLKKIIDDFKPEIVVHCAALADVEFCETHLELTRKVNILGTKILVDCLKQRQAKLIHISTDSLYDGLTGHYQETDAVRPQSIYTESKYQAESEALAHRDALIVRTCFFGWNILPGKLSLAEWVINELSRKRRIQGFRDVYTSIVYTFKLAELLDKAVEKDLKGIFHFASRDAVSKYEFAQGIAKRFHLDPSFIDSATIDDMPFKARRPKNLSLNCGKLAGQLQLSLPTVEESIHAFRQDFERGLPGEIRKGADLVVSEAVQRS